MTAVCSRVGHSTMQGKWKNQHDSELICFPVQILQNTPQVSNMEA